jgi:uncharacterized membrane protein YuzA (DUF378 family)
VHGAVDGDRARERLRDHPWLIVLAAGPAVAEALLVATLGSSGAAALAPQVTAPTPFDVFHDWRWLLVYHPSWLAFGFEVLALVVVRSVLIVGLVRAAWPATVDRPAWRDQLRSTVGITVLVALVLLPFAVLTFAMAVVSLSWLFFVSVPVLVIAALLLHRAPVSASWWRDRPTWETVRVVLITFLVVTAAGAVLVRVSGPAQVVIAGLVGVASAWCWLQLVQALAGGSPQPRRRPFVVVGLAGVLVLVVGGTAAGFAVSVAVENARTLLPPVAANASGPPVLIVKGFNSEWDGVTRRWVAGRYRIRRFSYAGLDQHGRPRPYSRAATHRSVRDLALELRTQVSAFHAATGQPVNLVAESEGSLVALAYLTGSPHAPVGALVALSPLLGPGRVFYPPLGDSGWGTAAATVMDGVARSLSAVGPVDVSADSPLFRSFVDEGPALRGLLRCPAPGRREFAVIPLDSGVSAPAPVSIGVPHAFVPAFHGGLLGDHTSAQLIGRVLAGRAAPGSGFWAGTGDVVGSIAAAWQAPSLSQGLEPAWRHLPASNDCPAVRAAIRRWLGPEPLTSGTAPGGVRTRSG